MIEVVYFVFFWFLILQVFIFFLLNIPTPYGLKGKIVRFLTTSSTIWFIMKIHLAACILAAFFFIDLNQTQSVFTTEKNKLKQQGTGHIGSQFRIGYLSYSILKVQRNKYITFMVIYVSMALNFYIRLLRYLYLKREGYDKNFSFKNRESLDQKKSPELAKARNQEQTKKNK